MPRSVRRLLLPAFLLLFYTATSLPWLIVTPPFDAPDEIAHYDHARYIAAHGHLPDHVPTALREGDWYTSHWAQPPLYYLLISVVIRATHAEAIAPVTFIEFDPADSALQGPSARRVILREPGERRATRALFLGRLVSWTFGAGLVLMLSAALGAAGASDRTRTLLIASLLLVPGVTANLAVVNNDSLAALLAAAAVAALFRAIARPEPHGATTSAAAAWTGIGLLIGLALSSKSTTAFLVPMGVVGAVIAPAAAPAARRSVRVVMVRLCALGAGAALCLSVTFVRNWLVFGDPFASDLAAVLTRFNPPPRSWTLWGPELYASVTRQLFEGFVARFGWSETTPRSETIWWLYRGLALGAMALCLVATMALGVLGRSTRVAVRISRVAAAGVVAHLVTLFIVNTVMFAASGRHLLPIVAPTLVLMYLGGAVAARAFARRGWSFVTSVMPAAVLLVLAAAWVSVFIELMTRFRFGG